MLLHFWMCILYIKIWDLFYIFSQAEQDTMRYYFPWILGHLLHSNSHIYIYSQSIHLRFPSNGYFLASFEDISQGPPRNVRRHNVSRYQLLQEYQMFSRWHWIFCSFWQTRNSSDLLFRGVVLQTKTCQLLRHHKRFWWHWISMPSPSADKLLFYLLILRHET